MVKDTGVAFTTNTPSIIADKITMKDAPQAVKATLWSYDVDKMDLAINKERIITNVLNYGTKPATDWLFQVYERAEIQKVLETPRSGEWDKKSLNLWTLMFGVTPKLQARFEFRP